VPPRRLRRRLEGTRARKPKAEHAGRNAPHPRGGNHISPRRSDQFTTIRPPVAEARADHDAAVGEPWVNG